MRSRMGLYFIAILIIALMTFGFPMWNGDEWEIYHLKDLGFWGKVWCFTLLSWAALGLTFHAAQEAQRVKTSEREANRDNVKRNHP